VLPKKGEFMRLVTIGTLILYTTLFRGMPGMAENIDLHDPTSYILSKFEQNNLILLGETHRKPPSLKFVANLIPLLEKVGVTHFAMEIPDNQQVNIDMYMEREVGIESIQDLGRLDCPDYRYLFEVLRDVGHLKATAIDLPHSLYKTEIMSRDEWMARSLMKIFDSTPEAKVLLLIGNLHTLKRYNWEDQVIARKPSIIQFLKSKRPEIKSFSVAQLIDEHKDVCEFSRKFSPLPGLVALDLTENHRGWKLGMLELIAVKPSECFELFDGLVVY
jgi:uncharacterized iron-regulated protein